ncbi:MAG: ATP-binding protein [Armatimonadota bacterium]
MTVVQFALFAATAYNLVLVYLILRNTRTHRAGRNFAWFILTTAAWSAVVAIMQFESLQPVAVWLARATFFIATLMCWSGLWFCLDFPQTSPKFRTWALALTGLGVFWPILCWTPYIIQNASFKSYGVQTVNGPLLAPFFVWLLVCVVASVIHIITKTRTLRGLERQQVRFVLAGIIGLAIAGSIPNLILPFITNSNQYAPLGGLASLFLTTSTTYAILRYRLLDITVVLRAGLIYSLTIGFLSLAFASLVPVLERALNSFFSFPHGVGSFLMAFVIALAFQPVRRLVQRWVDGRFFKSVYDFRVALREAGNALASATSTEALLATLEDGLSRTLRPRGIAIFLPGRDETLEPSTVGGQWDRLPDRLTPDDPILRYARQTDDVLLADELVRKADTPSGLGEQLQEMGIALAIPLIAARELTGIVFLGEKLSGDMYTTEDIGLLRILGKQAAVALDNVHHYEEMVRMNEYHARLLDIMQDGVIALDPQQRIITFNDAAERILGVPMHEALGKRLPELGVAQLPIDSLGELGEELIITTGGGMEIPALVTVTPFIRRWEVESSYLVVIRDLTALRELERQKLQAERFSSMGAMAASLAHEIKNPLVPIKMFAHLLPSRYDDAEFRKEFSETVMNEVERINRLVAQMLDLVRKPSSEKGVVDLTEVMQRLLTILHPQCERQGVTIRIDIAPDLPPIVGQAGQLYQSLLNVLTNAVQVMPNGGELRIVLAMEEDKVTCRIADSGPGVPEEVLPHIFEPLFTTKTDGHGLGLALTYQFIRANGGEISAESPPGSGLIVTVALPVWHRQEAELLCS